MGGAAVRFGVIVFPGSTGDTDCLYALEEVLGVSAQAVWHEESSLDGFDALVLPGGFSYGDALRPGAIARYSPAMAAVEAFAQGNGLVLGIGNGFQILCEAGLLPGSLLPNESPRFRSERVWVRVERADTPFTIACQQGQVLNLPVAHGFGRYYAPPETLARLEETGRIVLRYTTPQGEASPSANPDGALGNIAGLINEKGNVLGLMPHPERSVDSILGGTDGRKIFESMLRALVEAKVGGKSS